MITVRNHAKERLEAGELALGVGLRQARTVDIARIMKTAGYDFATRCERPVQTLPSDGSTMRCIIA
jgi:hypothetical protein